MEASASVQTADDGSIPGATEEEKQKTYSYWQSYNLDEYYENVKSLTFQTTFVPISPDEVRALLKYFVNPSKLSSEHQELVQQLQVTMDKIIDEYGQAFVKLGSRSPKDAVDKIPKITFILKEQLTKFPSTNNGEFTAMRHALMEAMSVDSAAACFDLFSYSSRIISDFNRDLKYCKERWTQSIVIREFCPIPLRGELRAFVCEGKLNALSQYYTNCYFPWLKENKETIISRVHLFHEALRACIPEMSSYIIDLVVYEELEEGKHSESGVTLVELNPWSDKTGSALFQWQDDKEILENGPFTFRILESEPKVRVGASWQALIDQAKEKKEETTKESKSWRSFLTSKKKK